MARISKPYFNLHQIQKGLYSAGGEFVLSDGSEYIGAYHILPTSQKF